MKMKIKNIFTNKYITKEVEMTAKVHAAIRNRANGHALEIRVWNILRLRPHCLEACISSGSKGLFDVWSVNYGPIQQTLCVVKRNGYINPRERKELARFMRVKPANTQVEFWYYKSPKKLTYRIMKTPEDFTKGKFRPTIFPKFWSSK